MITNGYGGIDLRATVTQLEKRVEALEAQARVAAAPKPVPVAPIEPATAEPAKV